MNDPLSLLSSIVSILVIWIAFDAGYRRYRADVLRDRLFQLRSQLFEIATDGRLGADGYQDTAYLRIRHGLDGFMRYGHQFTFFRLLVLLWSSGWWLDTQRAEARRASLIEAVSKHPLLSKKELVRIMREAEYAIVVHMINVNILGFMCLRVWECAGRLVRTQRGLRSKLLRLIEKNRGLLAPLEEDATWRVDREERQSIA